MLCGVQDGARQAFACSPPSHSAEQYTTLNTRLQRYYEPLRHPAAPGLSLAGVRLAIPGHASGLPVLRTLSLCACRRHYPGAADGCTRRSKITHPYQPSPVPLPSRPAHCPFRGLLSVHSRCGLHTHAVTYTWPLSEGFRHFVTSMPAPVASGWSGCRAGLAPAGEAPPFHGARGKPTSSLKIRRRAPPLRMFQPSPS